MRRNTTARTQAANGAAAGNTSSTGNTIVGSAVSLESHTTTVQARASLAVRIMMIVAAIMALAFAMLAGLNISASARFNQATASLNANLKQATNSSADLSALNASQQQTDAQFEDAARLGFALLPQLREAISANAAVSSELTQRIEQELAAQQGGNSANSDSGTTGVEGGTAKDSTTNDSSGLTDEQKKQVEELLKANQQSTDTNPSTNTQTDKGTKKQQTAKPW